MKRDIKIGHLGHIKVGDDAGSFLKIVDDRESTGGFLVLVGLNKDFSDGSDNWVENEEKLEAYFTVSGWEIEWLE